MNIKEAYELLDLPEGTDIQKVRQRFSEQYSEYRMQIDNAPTPNLRHRYEQNLALREEAFNLITGGASLDDSHDLPSSAPYEQSSNLGTDEPNNSIKAPSVTENMLLSDALSLLGEQETSSPAQIKTAFLTKKAELETELQKIKMEGAKQFYLQELDKLAQAWTIIEPWLQNKTNPPECEEDQSERAEVITLLGKKKRTLFVTLTIIISAIILLLIGGWFYFSKGDNIPAIVISNKWKKNFDEVKDYSEGFYMVKVKDKYGYADKNGKLITPIKYEGVFTRKFQEGLASVEFNGKMGFINHKGDEVIPLIYDFVGEFEEGLAMVVFNNEEIGYINTKGKAVIPLKYTWVEDKFTEGLSRVRQHEKWGFINRNGEAVVPLKYDGAGDAFSEGLVAVYKNGKWGFVNRNGEVVIPLKYDHASAFSEGLVSVYRNGKWGFINKNGEVIIPFKYDDGSAHVEKANRAEVLERFSGYYFSEGLAGVLIDKKWGYINHDGELVIPFKYDSLSDFLDGKALVHLDGKLISINKAGELLEGF